MGPKHTEVDSHRELFCVICIYCTVLYLLYCIVLYCVVLYRIVLYCIVLYCIKCIRGSTVG